ncbi:hypothetical protein [[Clostridium] aminophilum]|uniref:hypothetical protein n=1 Tax=[Clostridium] aminophilum TaxID=1526 RepID=UPI0033342CE8
MKKDNPFTLTFGKRPTEYISRFEATEMIVSTFTADNPVSQMYLIEGIRCSGKTALMTAVTAELEQDEDYLVIDLNFTQNLLDDFARRLVDSCQKFPDIIKQGFNISIDGFVYKKVWESLSEQERAIEKPSHRKKQRFRPYAKRYQCHPVASHNTGIGL